MENKELKVKDIPWGYALCFNDACNCKDACMHYHADPIPFLQYRGHPFRPLRNRLGLRMTDNIHLRCFQPIKQ